MKIGILTGGGDVPGLNPGIQAAALRLVSAGHQMLGIRRGWAGLLHLNPDDPMTVHELTMPLDALAVRTIDRSGGTFLHTSRTNPARVAAKDAPKFLTPQDGADYTPHVLRVLKHLGLDALITIGGDDTLSYSVHLHEAGFPVVAIPKTMDNDVKGTDYCIGFSTAISRSVEFITNLRTSTGSHERIAVVELFGRNSGETSLIAAHLANVDRCLISEVPFDLDRFCKLIVEDKRRNPSKYAMVTISEGAVPLGGDIMQGGDSDAYGHKKLGGIGQWLGDMVKKKTGEDIIYQNVAYLMRSGPPDALDQMVGRNYGSYAADLVMAKQFGYMVALREGRYATVPFSEVKGGARKVDVDALYDSEHYKPMVRSVAGKPMFLY